LFANSCHEQHEADRCAAASKGVIPADTGAKSPAPRPGRPTRDRSESDYESSGRPGENTGENVGLLVLQTVLSTRVPGLRVPQEGGGVTKPRVACGSRRKVLNLLVDRSTQRNPGKAKAHWSEISFRAICRKKWWNWTWFALAALSAIRVYYVREMIAALVIFSALFVLAAGAALILFLLGSGLDWTLTWAEGRAMQVAQVARRGWALCAELSKRPLLRSR
jgi:hypothetical protein